jgi:hypothetical protein
MNNSAGIVVEDFTEISSTASRSENRAAFFKKIQSRKYKFFLSLLLSFISSLLIIWFAALARATLTVLEKLEFDIDNVKSLFFNKTTDT